MTRATCRAILCYLLHAAIIPWADAARCCGQLAAKERKPDWSRSCNVVAVAREVVVRCVRGAVCVRCCVLLGSERYSIRSLTNFYTAWRSEFDKLGFGSDILGANQYQIPVGWDYDGQTRSKSLSNSPHTMCSDFLLRLIRCSRRSCSDIALL